MLAGTTPRPTPLLAGALLCLLGGQVLFAAGPPPVPIAVLLGGAALHVVGGVLAWLAVRHGAEAAGPAADPERRFELPAIAVVVAFAAALRLLRLDTVPLRIDGDAAGFAAAAAEFLGAEHPPLIGTGWQSHTNVYFFLHALPMRVLGETVFGMRAFGAVGGALGVWATYLLGRSLWGFGVGFWAAVVMAVLPMHLVFSRMGTEVVHVTWLLPLVALSVWRGWERDDWRWLLGGGLLLALSQYVYPGARLIPILVVVQVVLLALDARDDPRRWRRAGRCLVWLAVGVLAVYGPMVPYYLDHPDVYGARATIVSIFSSGWLEGELAHRPWWAVAGSQVRDAYLPFVFPLEGARLFFLSPQYLGPADAALAVLGAVGVWAGRRTPRWVKRFLAVHLLLGMFLAGVLTVDTPMPSRYVVFLPAVALLIGSGLHLLVSGLATAKRRWLLPAGLGLVAVSLALDVSAYETHDTRTVWDRDPHAQVATLAARRLDRRAADGAGHVFLATASMRYDSNPVLRFLTGKAGTDVHEELTCDRLADLVRQHPVILIAPAERLEELRRLGAVEVLATSRGEGVAGILEVPRAGACAGA